MKLLFCKCFGLGNAVMAIPAIKALASIPSVEQVDVLVGSHPDDIGAFDVLRHLQEQHFVRNLYVSSAGGIRYDHAICSIPFDGRWINGTHFFADNVIDGRTRPDPSTTGLVSWKKHEIVYQMDNAWSLGYEGTIPEPSFLGAKTRKLPGSPFIIYLGLGYKKDQAGFWSVKHWGNFKYAELIVELPKMLEPIVKAPVFFVTTGDQGDLVHSINPIFSEVAKVRDAKRNIHFMESTLAPSFETLRSCDMYVGNDTGMMHVAASLGIPTVPLFFLKNSAVKNHPWGQEGNVIDGVDREVLFPEVAEKVLSVVRG